MRSNILVLSVLCFYSAFANTQSTLERIPRKILPGIPGGEWKKNKRIAVERQIDDDDSSTDDYSSENDLVSWLKREAQASPTSNKSLTAQYKISQFIETKPFPLSLINRIQKAFDHSKHSPFTLLLNFFPATTLKLFITLSPCAYEKILSLSNYNKLNMGSISVIVNYLQKAPKNDICTTKLKKRLKEYFSDRHKELLRKEDITILEKDVVIKKPIKDILEILESPRLYALYLPQDIQDFATHIINKGEADQIFKLMSLNLSSQEMIRFFRVYFPVSHLDAVGRTYGAYSGSVPPFAADPVVADHDKKSIYTAELLALRNHNWGFLNPGLFEHLPRSYGSHVSSENERWKRLYLQRKTEKKSGKVTFLTLEDDYNSISMGTATPEQTEAFCANAENLTDQTAHFWNHKFNRKVMIKDALLGVCSKNKEDMKKAIYQLRMAAHKNESLDCSTVHLVERLPEFSWFISLRQLKPSVFKDIFKCGFTLESLIKMDEYIFILEDSHENLAIAIEESLPLFGIKNKKKIPHPSIVSFLKRNDI